MVPEMLYVDSVTPEPEAVMVTVAVKVPPVTVSLPTSVPSGSTQLTVAVQLVVSTVGVHPPPSLGSLSSVGMNAPAIVATLAIDHLRFRGDPAPERVNADETGDMRILCCDRAIEHGLRA